MKTSRPSHFQKDILDLPQKRKAALFDAMLSLPRAIGDSHLHSGLGIRNIHRSGIWEARAGLGLRLVFTLERDLLTLVRVGSHDGIRTYLREI